MLERKFDPRSDKISSGTDSLVIIGIKASVTTADVVVFRGIACGYLDPRSMYASMKRSFLAVMGRDPTISVAALAKR